MLKYVTPFWATTPPYSKIWDIFGNYERISTKFLLGLISLLARRIVLGEKLKYVTPSCEHTTPYCKLWRP